MQSQCDIVRIKVTRECLKPAKLVIFQKKKSKYFTCTKNRLYYLKKKFNIFSASKKNKTLKKNLIYFQLHKKPVRIFKFNLERGKRRNLGLRKIILQFDLIIIFLRPLSPPA